MEWNNIANVDEIEYKDGSFGKHYANRSAELAKKMGAKQLGFHMEILPPKNFSCPYHFHHREEELFIVFAGRATLRQNGHFREVGPGDIIHFLPGPEGAHQFYNHTDEDFKFFALSTMSDLEVCQYPDSGKAYVASLNKVFQTKDEVKYLEGEEDPAKNWPEEHLKK